MFYLKKWAIIFSAIVLIASCKDNCIEKDPDGACQVTCQIWQGNRCVHSCKKGLPCD
jgi:hypothetical protein